MESVIDHYGFWFCTGSHLYIMMNLSTVPRIHTCLWYQQKIMIHAHIRRSDSNRQKINTSNDRSSIFFLFWFECRSDVKIQEFHPKWICRVPFSTRVVFIEFWDHEHSSQRRLPRLKRRNIYPFHGDFKKKNLPW